MKKRESPVVDKDDLEFEGEDEELYPDDNDLKEFDPEAIDENTDMDSDPVEGQETAQFEDENEEDFNELEESVDEDEPVI